MKKIIFVSILLLVTQAFTQKGWDSITKNNSNIPFKSLSSAAFGNTNNSDLWVLNKNRDSIVNFDGSNWNLITDFGADVINAYSLNTTQNAVILGTNKGFKALLNNSLYDLNSTTWASYLVNLGSVNVKSWYFDSNGETWVSYENSLIKFSSDKQTFINYSDQVGGAVVSRIRKDFTGNFWFGTDDGIYVYDGASFNKMTPLSSSNKLEIYGFIIKADSTIWAGTSEGLFIYKQNKWGKSKKISGNIYSIVVDSYNNTWISTTNNGLYKIGLNVSQNQVDTLHITKNNSSLLDDELSSLYIHPITNKLYIATSKGISILQLGLTSELCKENTNQYVDKKTSLKCSGYSSNTLFAKVKNTNYTYVWSDASGNKLNSGNSDSIVVFNSKEYTLNISDSVCSVVNNINSTIVDTTLNTPNICLVSNEMNKNVIIWENIDNNYLSKYRIYKQNQNTNKFDLVHEQSKDQISVWVDTTSNIDLSLNRYKISLIDICGKESGLSSYHTTMFLIGSLDLNGSVNLTWNEYKGFEYESFEIWRSLDKINFTKLSTVPNNIFNFIDNNFTTSSWYQIRINKIDPCNSSEKDFSYVSSNAIFIEDKSLLLNSLGNQNISIFPNPSNGNYTLKTTSEMLGKSFKVLDVAGRTILTNRITNSTQNINISGFENGTYFLKVDNYSIVKMIKNNM